MKSFLICLLALGFPYELLPVSAPTNSDIWSAAQTGDVAVLNWYIDHGESPLALNNQGETPLMVAAKNGQEKVVEALIKYYTIPLFKYDYADINEKDFQGNTALSMAAQWGHFAVVKQLLSYGAVVDLYNKEGLTPLHLAVMGGHIEVASLLLDEGADSNAVDLNWGRTPLIWVCMLAQDPRQENDPHIPVEKSVQMINLLLARGADPTRVDYEGRTALEWARYYKIEPLIALLSDAMRVHYLISSNQSMQPLIRLKLETEMNAFLLPDWKALKALARKKAVPKALQPQPPVKKPAPKKNNNFGGNNNNE